jgi:hypothetical protein
MSSTRQVQRNMCDLAGIVALNDVTGKGTLLYNFLVFLYTFLLSSYRALSLIEHTILTPSKHTYYFTYYILQYL